MLSFLEQIEGPLSGCYAACYALRSNDGYIGYAKLYAVPPTSAWDTTPALHKVAAGPLPRAGDALAAVRRRAALYLSSDACFN